MGHRNCRPDLGPVLLSLEPHNQRSIALPLYGQRLITSMQLSLIALACQGNKTKGKAAKAKIFATSGLSDGPATIEPTDFAEALIAQQPATK